MQLEQILFTQGFGTRRACRALIEQGAVAVDGRVCTSPQADFVPQALAFEVRGEPWHYREKAYLMLHKPAGTECSHRPGAWPSVYTLLPLPLRQRPNAGGVDGVQAVGRLDQDTTGLLLLTDDGPLIHRLNSPRHHVPKVYEVETAEALRADAIARLLDGVHLQGEPQPVRAAACEACGTHALRLTLVEGKYHQVKRMIGALGNRVVRLHRSRYGAMTLPPDLAPGQLRYLTQEEIAALRGTPASAAESRHNAGDAAR